MIKPWASSSEKVPSNIHKMRIQVILRMQKSIIGIVAFQVYILNYPMILLADSKGPDQTVNVQADLGL